MKPEDDPDFQPGFRFSGFDATILIVGALTAIGVAIFWLPLAAGISGGVAGSALLALYFTPAVFRIMTYKPVRRLFGYRPEQQAMPAE